MVDNAQTIAKPDKFFANQNRPAKSTEKKFPLLTEMVA